MLLDKTHQVQVVVSPGSNGDMFSYWFFFLILLIFSTGTPQKRQIIQVMEFIVIELIAKADNDDDV